MNNNPIIKMLHDENACFGAFMILVAMVIAGIIAGMLLKCLFL